MKRYIKSESYRRRELPNNQAKLKALRQDIRNVASCRNEQDLENLEIQSWNSKYAKRIWNDNFEKQGIVDFEDKIDFIIDWLYENARYTKETISRFSSEISKADEVFNRITKYLANYKPTETFPYLQPLTYEVKSDEIYVYPEKYSRADLIRFIDHLIRDLDGRYYGTGRGGSWTSWNVLIDGIEFQIGPSDTEDCWTIREV